MQIDKLEKQRTFLLFAGDQFYPAGGWGDFIGYFPDIESAKTEAMRKDDNCSEFGWAHIVDATLNEVVLQGNCDRFNFENNDKIKWEWEDPRKYD